MYRNFPTDMPDIAMPQLTEEELEDLRDVSLADAILEARRGLKIKFDRLRETANAQFHERLATIQTQALGAATSSPAATADVPC